MGYARRGLLGIIFLHIEQHWHLCVHWQEVAPSCLMYILKCLVRVHCPSSFVLINW